MGRILGVDFGSKRVGLALSDSGHVIAFPYRTLEYVDSSDLMDWLVALIEELKVEKIVVGLPLGLSGRRTSQTILTEDFASALGEKSSVPIELFDERLTSVEAMRVIRSRGLKPSLHKHLIDETAAAIFLQTYLDSHSPR